MKRTTVQPGHKHSQSLPPLPVEKAGGKSKHARSGTVKRPDFWAEAQKDEGTTEAGNRILELVHATVL